MPTSKKQNKTQSLPASCANLGGFAMKSLCALLVASSVSAMACQPKATHPSQEAKAVGKTVLVLTAGPQLVPSSETLLQTQKVLNQRLRREGFGVNAVKLDGKKLRVTLPAMSAEKLDALKKDVLTRRGLVSLAPMVEQTPLFATLKAEANAADKGVSVVKETWRGVDQKEHQTHTIRHAAKATLEAFLANAKAQPTKGQTWALQQRDNGSWAAYLLNTQDALQVRQLKQVQTVSEQGQSDKVSVSLTLQSNDAKKLHELTKRHLGSKVAVRIDNKIYAAPVVKAAISGGAVRLSMLASGSTHPLVRLLGAGALPIDVQITMAF